MKKAEMDLEQALMIVRAAGYRVTKPRERTRPGLFPELNAVGKPFKTPLTKISRLFAPYGRNMVFK